MRCLLKVELCTDTANTAIRDGSLGKTIRSILDDRSRKRRIFWQQMENGQPTFFLDIQNASQIPALAEPWFLAFNASVEIVPVMTIDDLTKAAPDFEKVVTNYGGYPQPHAPTFR